MMYILICYAFLKNVTDVVRDNKTSYELRHKHVFTGYHLNAGGVWSGDYLVVSADEYRNAASDREVHVHRIKELFPEKETTFPL